MRLSPSFSSIGLRLLRESDLPWADSLREIAGWNQTMADWRRLLAGAPDGCFVAEWDGAPAGVITTITYGIELAWIGMALVHPDFRRRGAGRTLLQTALNHLEKKKVRCVKLDATPQGKPLYLSLGFKPEWTFTRWQRLPDRAVSVKPRAGADCFSNEVNLHGLTDLRGANKLPNSLTAFDAAAFGADRRSLLESLARDALRGFASGREPGGVNGYGFLRRGARALYLGPVISEPVFAERLWAALLDGTGSDSIFWDIPDANSAAAAFAESRGFTRQRSLTRMHLGPNATPGQPAWVHGIAAPELG